MESTLSLRKSDLEAEIGHFLGYGRGADNGGTTWDSYQSGDIDSCLKSGLRSFYFPPVAEGRGDAYDWSFLRPTRTLTLVSGDSTLNLPDDFGGIEGDITMTSTASSAYYPIPVVGEGTVRGRYASLSSTETGRPELAAVQPIKGTGAAHGQRFQLYVWPIADADYSLSFTYYIHPDALTGNSPYAYGGMAHAETILESCLAIAEQRLDDASAIHSAKFQERLAASIAVDRRLKPQLLGYNGDGSDDYGCWRQRGTLYNDLVTFNGTQWD